LCRIPYQLIFCIGYIFIINQYSWNCFLLKYFEIWYIFEKELFSEFGFSAKDSIKLSFKIFISTSLFWQLVLRDNDLIELPPETGELSSLKELHLQNNRLQVLPPELGNVDLVSPKRILKAENNPWISEIADQFALGASHVMTYLKTDDYLNRFKRFTSEFKEPPPKKEREKSVKKKKEDKKKWRTCCWSVVHKTW